MSSCACGALLAPAGMDVPASTGMCASCAASAVAAPFAEAARSNLVAGVGLGALAALVAAGAWYGVVAVTDFQVGIIAVAVGWLVGRAVVLGAGATGRALQAAAVVLTLLSMSVAEYLIDWHYAKAFFAAEGMGEPALLLPPADAILVVGESLAADPLTLVFWVIALAAAWKVAGTVVES